MFKSLKNNNILINIERVPSLLFGTWVGLSLKVIFPKPSPFWLVGNQWCQMLTKPWIEYYWNQSRYCCLYNCRTLDPKHHQLVQNSLVCKRHTKKNKQTSQDIFFEFLFNFVVYALVWGTEIFVDFSHRCGRSLSIKVPTSSFEDYVELEHSLRTS